MEGSYPHLEGSPMQTFSQAQLLQQQPQMFLQQGSTHSHLRSMQIQKQHLQRFWQQQVQEMRQIAQFKQHQLPLARIKKIMKSDEEVKMISAEAPVLFSKACELFILELTLRSWLHTEENKRRTLQRNDIAGAVSRGDILDFLVDIVRRDDIKDEQYGGHWTDLPHVESVPYGGMPFHFMNSQPYHHTDTMAYTQALSQQLISQEPLMPEQQLMYQPPQH